MTNDIISVLDAILSSREVDAGSMQVFDVIALATRQDKQIRMLANYLLNSGELTFTVDTSETVTTVKTVNGNEIATIAVTVGTTASIVLIMTDRFPWQVRAFNQAGTVYQCTLVDKVITIDNVVVGDTVTIQLI